MNTTMTHNARRAVLTTIGVVIVVGGIWVTAVWHRTGPSHTDEQHTRQQREASPETETSGAVETGPPQAYAMVTPTKQQLIGVKTAVVETRPLETTVRAVGRVDYNEERIAHVNLRVSGWIEDLFVDFTGQVVRKGQPLFTLYSPDLVASQDEYLLALRTQAKVKDSPLAEVQEQAEHMVDAARDRLRLWTVSDQQLDELARRGKAKTSMPIYSPFSGYVTEKKVFRGMFVEPEMRLYTIADLSTVWMNAEIYEFEVPFIKVGQQATVTFSSYPGQSFHGRVSYIYPYLNEQARTVKVRLELPNPGLRIKPEMYGDVLLKINRGKQVAVPEQAVMDSGTRKQVFLVRGEGLFEPREVKVGPKIGAFYEIQEGVEAGDRVVTSGNFLIDSESKLMAATDMMGSLGMGGIKMEQAQMGKMDMGGMPMGEAQPGATKPMAKGPSEKKVGSLTVALSTEPPSPRIGENLIRVIVKDAGGNPLANATMQLTYTMPMPGMMPATVPMKPGKDGAYEAKVNLGMGGQWDLTVTVQRAGQADVKEGFSVTAGGSGGMSGMQGM
jgi:membrane fusion protein, copper/silver efflux system